MSITVIGSHLCPDTLYAIHELRAAGIGVEFKNILASHADLKAYLALRDGNALYDGIRGTSRLGIPCFVKEDGSLTLSLNEVLGKI